MSDQYVTVVSPNDVLFGRGSGPNDHEGNIKFRELVAQRKAEYMATNHRQTKAKIAKAIVGTVFASNGRFLKKLENADLIKLGFQQGMDVYQVVDDDTVMEKAKQALRQNRDKQQVSPKSSKQTTTLGRLSPKNSYNSNSMPPPAVPTLKPPMAPTSYEPIPLNHPAAVMNPPLGNQVQHQPQLQVQPQMPVQVLSHNNNQAPLQNFYTDSDGYATYTTTLDDPEDERLFTDRPPISVSAGTNRRSSLLGGRKDGTGRNDSMRLGDVWRKDAMSSMKGESMQMSELMESFKGMSTAGGLDSSNDTIGTIEGNFGGTAHMSGISNMSMMSMASGISLFKSSSGDHDSASGSGGGKDGTPRSRDNSSDMMMTSFREDTPNDQKSSPPPMKQQTSSSTAVTGNSGLWDSSKVNTLMQGPLDGSSTNMNSSLNIGGLNDHSAGSRTMGQLQHGQSADSMNLALGSSSLAMLREVADQSFSNTYVDDNNKPGRILPPEQHRK